MTRSTSIVRTAAALAAVSLVLAACGSGDDDATPGASGTGGSETSAEPSGDPLHIGTLLPVTGSLAQLGPPEIAGVQLAVNEINDAGGVFGADVELTERDSSDADNAAIGIAAAQELLSAGVSAVIGAASSAVTRNVVDDITGAGVVQVSPANTATDLSGYDDFFFRTAPPDSVQGDALAQLMISDGASSIGALVFSEMP